MTTMKRTVSWITALAMILMLCTCTVITYAANNFIFEDAGGGFSSSYPYNSTAGGFIMDNAKVYSTSDTSKTNIKNNYTGWYCGTSTNPQKNSFTVPAGLPAGEYAIQYSNTTWIFNVYKRLNSTLVSDVTATDVVYGSGEAPTVTATYDGTTALVQGTDFYIDNYARDETVENNTAEDPGWGMPTVPGTYVATLAASGLYRYDGNPITVQFKVLPKDIDTLPDSDVYLKYFDDTYTGNEITPDVAVFDGAQKLVEGVDYFLSYDNNVAAGAYTASVKINGMGNYTGIKTLNFSIVKPTVVYQSSPTYVAAVATPSNPTLKSGDKNNSVSTLQTRLNELGYNCGEVDGVFGAKTRAAVIAFQKANNLSVDGVAGPQTWAALGAGSYVYYTPVTVVSTPVYATASTASHSTLSRGKTGDEVKELQTLLNKMGYDCGLVDGVFGAKTEAAVRAFQAATNLAVDGIVGPLTWNKIDD